MADQPTPTQGTGVPNSRAGKSGGGGGGGKSGTTTSTDTMGGGTSGGKGGSQPAGNYKPGETTRTKGQGGGKSGSPFTSGTEGTTVGGTGGFFGDNSRPIAGLNDFMMNAGQLAGGLGQAGSGPMANARNLFGELAQGQGFMGQAVRESDALKGLGPAAEEAMNIYRGIGDRADQQVTGRNVYNDPAFKAAQQNLKDVVSPMIADQAGLSGLGGSSAVTNAMGKVSAETLLPLIQDSMGREERGIDRGIAGQLSQAGGLMSGAGMETQNLLSRLGVLQGAEQMGQAGTQAAAQGLQGLGGQEFSQLLQTIGTQQGLGSEYRGVEQEQLDAPYNEQMRQFEEALNAMYGPLNMIGGTLGASSTGGGKGK